MAVVLVVLLVLVLSAESVFSQNFNCSNLARSCGECMQNVSCVWCSQPISEVSDQYSSNLTESRCMLAEQALQIGCTTQHTSSGGKSFIQVIKNDSIDLKAETPIQLQPQHVKVRLRVGETQRIEFVFHKAPDYPMDLYYLMDLSRSMVNHTKKLSTLGARLAETMMKISKNFTLGFGSFIDKPILPMTAVAQNADTYSFRNNLKLSNNVSLFQTKVKESGHYSNIDSPEGALDGMMQAIVCKEEIGWRKVAQHLLIVSSDAGFHIAGNGKIAGIIERHDEKCHLDDQGFYTHSLLLDYPSPAQIRYQAKKNNIAIIFAIVESTSNQIAFNLYKEFAEFIGGSTSCDKLSQDSSNVLELVAKEYQKISGTIQVGWDAENGPVEPLDVQISGSCPHYKDNKCENITSNDKIMYNITLKATRCIPNTPTSQSFKLKVDGVHDSIQIDVEIICDCQCEKEDHKDFIPQAEQCNKSGNFSCGICQCEDTFNGKQCECSSADVGNATQIEKCIRADDKRECSGRGVCRCGMCVCNDRNSIGEKYTGQYCECDNQCPLGTNNLPCSGPDQGLCRCTACECRPGWSGEECQCRDSNETCLNNDEICSGRGTCRCGQCVCNQTEGMPAEFSGPLCEIQTNWNSVNDSLQEFCVKCLTSPESFNEECKAKCGDQSEVDVLALILGIAGGIVAAGILLLIIWKIATTVHDKREYEKFEKERKEAQWGRSDNPLYKQAVSTFQNPTFES